jgi:hypothetical protein
MKIKLLIILVLCYGCSPSYKIGGSYALGKDVLIISTAERKFSLVETGELGFYKYAEGGYIIDKNKLYLNANGFDSCIKYSVASGNHHGKLTIKCNNYDPRINILYTINKKKYNSSKDGSLILDYPNDSLSYVEIDLPFPDRYNFSCYKKRNVLHTAVNLSALKSGVDGVVITFTVNYNYFSYTPLTDTLTILSSKRIRSNGTEYLYKKTNKSQDDLSTNYLNRCMVPYSEQK